jgi:hypothetical protein
MDMLNMKICCKDKAVRKMFREISSSFLLSFKKNVQGD